MLEVCCASREALEMAVRARVERIELCEDLDVGGLTPTPGFLREALHSGLRVHVLVRPRAGDFVYREFEIQEICDSIREILDSGAHGMVVGSALANQELDFRAMERFKSAAGDRAIYCHRVFDTVPDQRNAMRELSGLGFSGVLTSGGPGAAIEHVDTLRDLVETAPSGFTVLVGGKVRAANLAELMDSTGARAFHTAVGDPSRSGEFERELGELIRIAKKQ